MRTSIGAIFTFLLAAAAPACILGDANPFLDDTEGCLEAGEQVIVDLSDAKTKPAIDAATVPAWTRSPDSDADHLHLRVVGCEEGWSSWSALQLVGDVPEGASLVVKTRTHEDATWIEASLSEESARGATFSTYSEGSDLEVIVELADAPGARVDQLVLIRSCSTYDSETSEDPDDSYDYDYSDEGC